LNKSYIIEAGDFKVSHIPSDRAGKVIAGVTRKVKVVVAVKFEKNRAHYSALTNIHYKNTD
jgi:hypothetical protein